MKSIQVYFKRESFVVTSLRELRLQDRADQHDTPDRALENVCKSVVKKVIRFVPKTIQIPSGHVAPDFNPHLPVLMIVSPLS